MPIDWSRVSELRAEIGSDDFAEVAELFLDEVAQAVSALDQNDDAGAVQAGLHFIKGSALNLGFAGLANICSKGESDATSGIANLVDIPALQALFQSELDEFNKGRQRLTD